MTTITIDTNILLDDSNIIYKLSKEYDKILIPSIVLKELDKHKYNPDLSYSARRAITSIRQFKDEYPDKIVFHITPEAITKNDEWIIEASKKHEADLATKDISMSIISDAYGVKSKLYDIVLNNIYNPYHEVNIENLKGFDYQQIYTEKNYNTFIDVFSKALDKELNVNAWFFIFITYDDTYHYVYANNPLKKLIQRIDNEPNYRLIKFDDGKSIKTKDVFQSCALYAFTEAPNVLITGKWGSGKSLLSCGYALATNQKKTFITRPPIGINKKYDIGFVPGDKHDKMSDWLGGFTSSLYYIYGNTNGQHDKNQNSYNYVKDVLFEKKYEILQFNSIQGLSLLDNDMLIVDEIQLLPVDYMSMLLSRPTKGGKLILTGDLKQTYNVVKPSESGLLKLLRLLPHHSLAYVDLPCSYRSDIIEIADQLQDRTIG